MPSNALCILHCGRHCDRDYVAHPIGRLCLVMDESYRFAIGGYANKILC